MRCATLHTVQSTVELSVLSPKRGQLRGYVVAAGLFFGSTVLSRGSVRRFLFIRECEPQANFLMRIFAFDGDVTQSKSPWSGMRLAVRCLSNWHL